MAELEVRVQPRSSRNELRVVEGVVKVWLTAPPTDGQANASLCALVAEQVGVPKSSVQVTRGHTSRNKTLRIDGLSAADVALRILPDDERSAQ